VHDQVRERAGDLPIGKQLGSQLVECGQDRVVEQADRLEAALVAVAALGGTGA
jgi:hypothetical protein